MKMLSMWDKDDGNKVCMMGIEVYWRHYDAKCEQRYIANTF